MCPLEPRARLRTATRALESGPVSDLVGLTGVALAVRRPDSLQWSVRAVPSSAASFGKAQKAR